MTGRHLRIVTYLFSKRKAPMLVSLLAAIIYLLESSLESRSGLQVDHPEVEAVPYVDSCTIKAERGSGEGKAPAGSRCTSTSN